MLALGEELGAWGLALGSVALGEGAAGVGVPGLLPLATGAVGLEESSEEAEAGGEAVPAAPEAEASAVRLGEAVLAPEPVASSQGVAVRAGEVEAVDRPAAAAPAVPVGARGLALGEVLLPPLPVGVLLLQGLRVGGGLPEGLPVPPASEALLHLLLLGLPLPPAPAPAPAVPVAPAK